MIVGQKMQARDHRILELTKHIFYRQNLGLLLKVYFLVGYIQKNPAKLKGL